MFSEHATVTRIGKNLYFQFLVFDAREKTPLNEAEARCYAVRHGRSNFYPLRFPPQPNAIARKTKSDGTS